MFRRVGAWRLGVAFLFVAAMVSALVGCGPREEAWPKKAIDLIVAFAPGGGTDVNARIMVKYLSAELGVPVNVVNKAGGNQITGTLAMLQSPPDGHTLLVDQAATSSLHAGTLKEMPYKLEERSFGPVWGLGTSVFHVNGKSPWKSLKDVVEAAKKDPGSFTWARGGGYADFVLMQLLYLGGVDVAKTKPVDFQGMGPANTAVAGGHVMLGGGGLGGALPLHQSGDLRILATVGDKRTSALPDIPSSKEAGFPVDLLNWYGVSGPKDMPKAILDRLDSAVKKMSQNAEFTAEMNKIAAQPTYMAPAQMKDLVLKEVDVYRKLSSVYGATK